jgi:hypothetical protein
VAAHMRTWLTLLLLLTALALAGCGGTSGPGSGGGSAETEAGVGQAGEDSEAPGDTNDPIYIEAGNICVNLPLEQLAVQYGTEADAEKVAEAVAAEYPEADKPKAKAGCLAVLTEGGRGGDG